MKVKNFDLFWANLIYGLSASQPRASLPSACSHVQDILACSIVYSVYLWVVPWCVHLGSELTDPLCCLSVSEFIPVASGHHCSHCCAVKLEVDVCRVGTVEAGQGLVCVCVCVERCGGCPEKRPIVVSTLPEQSVHLDESSLIVLTVTAWCCLERRDPSSPQFLYVFFLHLHLHLHLLAFSQL